MGKCKDCKFWQQPSEGNHGFCHELNDPYSLENPIRALYNTPVQYVTEPDFGCILGRDKETGASFNSIDRITRPQLIMRCEQHSYRTTGRSKEGYAVWKCAYCADEKIGS